MNVPRKLTIVPEMVESVRTHRILIHVVAQSTIWMCRSIVKIVQVENANDVSFFLSSLRRIKKLLRKNKQFSTSKFYFEILTSVILFSVLTFFKKYFSC